MASRFQTFSSSVRPIRIAVLTRVDDPDWQHTCLAIIEFFTKIWGGVGAIVIPTDGISIDEVFWALLSAHDPDLIFTYERRYEDMRRTRPESFAEIVAQHVSKATQSGINAEAAEKEIAEALAS